MVSISMPKQHELTMCKLYALKHLKFNTKTKIKTLFCLILNKFQTYSLVSSKPSPLTIFSKCLSTFLAQYNMFLDILSLKKLYFELNSGWNRLIIDLQLLICRKLEFLWLRIEHFSILRLLARSLVCLWALLGKNRWPIA